MADVSDSAPLAEPPEGAPGSAADSFAVSMARARAGSKSAVGRLIEGCRDYLLLVAQRTVPIELRPKLGPSDVVQETFLEAQAQFAAFRGETEQEFQAWLRAILRHNLANLVRSYLGTAQRNVRREVSIDEHHQSLDLAAGDETPSAILAGLEEAELVEQALSRLPPDYQLAINLRNWERLSFAEVGQRLDRSEEAARKLWSRAVVRLEEELSGGRK